MKLHSLVIVVTLCSFVASAFSPGNVPFSTPARSILHYASKPQPSNDEASHVRAIRACKSSIEVQSVLKELLPLSPNVAAAALRTMVKFDKQSPSTIKALPMLLQIAGEGVVLHHDNPRVSNMTLYSLQDVLVSLSLLGKAGMVPMANMICEILSSDISLLLERLQPRRCVEILEATNALQLDSYHPHLMTAISRRLSKSDALGKLSPPKLVEALHNAALYDVEDEALVGFVRRLCKQNVRRELGMSHIVMALDAAGRLVGSDVEDDARRMAYSLLIRELSRNVDDGNASITMMEQLTTRQAAIILNAMSKLEWDTLSERIEELCSVIERRIDEVSPGDVALILQSFSELQINAPGIVGRLCSQLQKWIDDGKTVKPQQISIILTTIYRLCGKDEVSSTQSYIVFLKRLMLDETCETFRKKLRHSDIATFTWFLSEAGPDRDPVVGRLLGSRLHSITNGEIGSSSLTMALRYAVKLYDRDHPSTLKPYLDATILACRNSESIISQISFEDLGFLVEALVIAKCIDEEVYLSLAKAAIRPDFVDECSPSSARRIIASFTTIIPRIHSTRLLFYQEKMFDLLGASLLSIQLKPYEAADAVFMYAKAGYVSDMGVFDHLTELVSQTLSEHSTRAIAQCLWACAKMYMWEPNQFATDALGLGAPDLAYLKSARVYAKHLADRENELTAIDLAQSCWGIGRLGIRDLLATEAFANRANKVLSECSSFETSNILWGLSKVGYGDEDNLVKISRRMLGSDIDSSPQEAACVLYALGNAGIREDEVFDHLTGVLMAQTENVSAQAIANALWAHNVVGKLPPSKLLQTWASDKLGLSGFVQPLDPSFEMYS